MRSQLLCLYMFFGSTHTSLSIKSLGLRCYKGYTLRSDIVRNSFLGTYLGCVQSCLQEHDPRAKDPTAQCKMISFSGDKTSGTCLQSLHGFAGEVTTVEPQSGARTCTTDRAFFMITSFGGLVKMIPFAEATPICASLGPGFRMATYEEVEEAYEMGYGRCNDAWVTDGKYYMALNKLQKCTDGPTGPFLNDRTSNDNQAAYVFCFGRGMADLYREYDSRWVFRMN